MGTQKGMPLFAGPFLVEVLCHDGKDRAAPKEWRAVKPSGDNPPYRLPTKERAEWFARTFYPGLILGEEIRIVKRPEGQ